MATHMLNRKKCRDRGQPCFYQPIFNKFWAEEYITYDGIRLQVSFWIFWWQKWLNLMFSGDSWGIWITWFGKDYTIHFLKKALFIFGPPFLNLFLGNSFYCSYDGITGHFLDPKWWIVLSCICLFKKCMSKTSMHPCRKWIVQSNKTSNFTCFFHFLGFWLGQNFSGEKMRVTWVHPEMSIGINMWSAQIIRWNSSSSWTWQK